MNVMRYSTSVMAALLSARTACSPPFEKGAEHKTLGYILGKRQTVCTVERIRRNWTARGMHLAAIRA
jgi:hypothetical protein